MKIKFIIFITLLPLFIIIFTVEAKDQAALEKRLAYLETLPEVSWVDFDNNNVYIGFKSRPRDICGIINAAAIFGNRAYGFGVHVWAFTADSRHGPVHKRPCYGLATARYGKIEKNTCR